MTVFNLGSVNIDHFYRLPHLPQAGETLAATGYMRGLGGKGANQSVAAVRAGAQVVHLGAVNTDDDWTPGELARLGVSPDHLARVAAPTGHAVVATEPGGENQIIIHPGANRALPLTALVIGSFATLTMLTKNSFLDQIKSQYVVTARAKGLTQNQVLYGHVFRNGMLIVIAGFPSAIVGILFTSALLIEIIFSLDGLGLLGYEAAINRDYPVMFATLYIFTLLGLVMNLIGDLMYVLVDPRIDFESRDVG
jgi:hypothetical protein